MSELKDLFNSLNIPQEKLEELAGALKSNPMAAMGIVQQLNLPPEFLQKVMAIVMANPNAIFEFAAELGLSKEKVEEAKESLKGMVPNPADLTNKE